MISTSPKLRVLIVGSRILPFRHAGDKNYWLEVFRELSDRGVDLDVLSVTLEPVPEPTPYACEFVRPLPIHLGGGNRFSKEYRRLQGTGNYLSKTASFGRIVRAIRRHVRARRPDAIHFVSNYGPVMALLKPLMLGVPMSISAPTYNGGKLMYDRALLTSFAAFDRIVPFSDAFGQRLERLGVPREKLATIRWAVDPDRYPPPSDTDKERARRELGVLPGEKVVLWAGFLQQMVPVDLEFSVRAAGLTLLAAPAGWRFFFCLKPEHYDPAFRRFERPGIVVAGTAEKFHLARTAADVMLSPLTDLRSIAAPPLTWIESMALGIPVITTPLLGVDEIVIDGVNGYLTRNPEEVARCFSELLSNVDRMAEAGRRARHHIQERFALSASVTEYMKLWASMSSRGDGSPGRSSGGPQMRSS